MKALFLLTVLVGSFATGQEAQNKIKILPTSEILPQRRVTSKEPVLHYDCGNIYFPSGNTNGNSDEGNVEGFKAHDTPEYIVLSTGGGRVQCLIPRRIAAEKGYTAESLHKKLQCQNPNSCYWGNYLPDNYVTLECIGDWKGGSNYSGTTIATDIHIRSDPSGYSDTERKACPAPQQEFCQVVGDDDHKSMVDKFVNDYCDQSKKVAVIPADSPQAMDCRYTSGKEEGYSSHGNGLCSVTRHDHQVCCHMKSQVPGTFSGNI